MINPRTDIARNSLPWVDKHRPKTLDEIKAHVQVISTIKKLLKSESLPHLLLYGPPGTGKTSTVLAIARELYGPNAKSHILELNASDDSGISTVREEIKTFCGSKRLFFNQDSSSVPAFKLVILDEADNLSKAAQTSLRRVIEDFSATSRFCLICNYVSKIFPAIQSRCTRFRFPPLDEPYVVEKLLEVIKEEKVPVSGNLNASHPLIKALCKLGKGDMRQSINLLQSATLQLSKLNSKSSSHDSDEDSEKSVVTTNLVYQIRGILNQQSLHKVLHSLWNDDFKTAYKVTLTECSIAGTSLSDLVTYISEDAFSIGGPYSDRAKAFVLSSLAEMEVRLAKGSLENIEFPSLIGLFCQARERNRL